MSAASQVREASAGGDEEKLAIVRAALKLRGLTVEAVGTLEAGLEVDSRFLDEWYHMLLRYSFRLFLRDLIKYRRGARISDLRRYCSGEVVRKYLGYVEQLGLAMKRGRRWRLTDLRVNSFGPTLEWLVAEVMQREFGAFAAAGVRLCRPSVGGDYDTIALVEGRCVYVEAKSAPPRQLDRGQIRAFCRRVRELAPDVAILLNDTHLRMADKLVPLLARELAIAGLGGAGEGARFERVCGETFHFRESLFVTNSHPDIRANLTSCLALHWRRGFGGRGVVTA